MAAASSPSFGLLLFLLTSWLSSPGSAFVSDWHHITPSAPVEPHFTKCTSQDQATFSCWWSPGSFHNLSDPGALRVFYKKRIVDAPTENEWKECPEYFHSRRECFFDRNHTSIWTPYCLQLRSRDNVTYFNTDDCFSVENIVRPDPPVALNWTCLNVSPSGLTYDIMVTWEPPASADVRMGWMSIVYEVQYREKNSTTWETMEVQLQPETEQTIYGLHVDKVYEVHIRCRMKAFTKFGDFSESVFVQVSRSPNKDAFSLLTLVIVLGVVAAVILIMWVVVSQQHRLMVILLPPVPAPKIKGVDPELLKKGKLDELNFILSGGGLVGGPTYSPDFYQDEPWVEFIEVDVKDPDTGEKEDNQASDTERLLGGSQSSGHRDGCSTAFSFPDDGGDSERPYASNDPDEDGAVLTSTLLPGQPDDREASLYVDSEQIERPPAHSQSGVPQTWVTTDFYAQVSNVMPFGGVVLSPGQQLRTQEGGPASNEDAKKGKKDCEEEKKQKERQFQLLDLEPDGDSSTPPYCSMPDESCQPSEPRPNEAYQSPYVSPDSPQAQLFAPVADYTVVQELDSQRSVLLDPPPVQSAPLCLSQHPLKSLPAMPVGYVTPDLQGTFSP
ncbi:growth hormone receptor a isoform X2 [Hippocampus comes]|uniref:growth hormone receptor a isoform X1 n=1 Tax=Hippocampus comes TaxID=109280 RepID=UPI00094E3B84|nr:PREDICTED: growth hormone receptor-like isoform X1 [Hippocampus comes]XP_019728276.1 PREDICTED: growth hormone receptor-like isoform X2 [Hippocampus comes]